MHHLVIGSRRLLAAALAACLATAAVAIVAASGASGADQRDDGGGGGLSVRDRLDIQDLYARYSQDLDGAKADDFVTNVFAPDGRFHDPSVCAVGTEELRQLALTFGKPFQDHREQHLPYNIVIQGKGDRASGHAYVSVLAQDPEKGLDGADPHIAVMGTYTDTFVKSDGRWLIQDREVWRPGPITQDPDCPTDIASLD